MENWIKRIYWFHNFMSGSELVIFDGKIWTKECLFEYQYRKSTSINDFIDVLQEHREK